jgi:hypothetical protein
MLFKMLFAPHCGIYSPPSSTVDRLGGMSQRATTRCTTHGTAYETFVCEHLARDPRQRWYSEEPSGSNPWPDAWCGSCNALFEEFGEWNESNAGSCVLRCYATSATSLLDLRASVRIIVRGRPAASSARRSVPTASAYPSPSARR